MSRLPLISGMSPSLGSMRSRSNWKLRPCGRVLLELAVGCDHLVGHVGVTQQLEQEVDRFGQRRERRRPALEVGAALGGPAVLPGVVGRQVEFAGAARDAGTAADAHEPLVLGQRLAGLAGHRVERREVALELAHHLIEHRLGDRGIAAELLKTFLCLSRSLITSALRSARAATSMISKIVTSA